MAAWQAIPETMAHYGTLAKVQNSVTRQVNKDAAAKARRQARLVPTFDDLRAVHCVLFFELSFIVS